VNCKPGDMAEVVKPAENGLCRCYIGRRISCGTFFFSDNGLCFWNLANPWDACDHVVSRLPLDRKLFHVDDALLKPIRPPGIDDSTKRDADKPVEVGSV